MSTETKPTPTPWKQEASHIWAPDAKAMIATVCEPYPKETVIQYTQLEIGSENIREAFANAALIVRAVNAYDELIAALELYLKTYVDTQTNPTASQETAVAVAACAALKKARG